jgi:hypothetical protein
MDNMKCLKNTKTGNIIRVTDIQACQMEGRQWTYTSKTEWKGQFKKEEPTVVVEVVEQTISEKQLKRKK